MKVILLILALTLSGCKTTQMFSVPTVTIQKSGPAELKEVMEEVPAKKGWEGVYALFLLILISAVITTFSTKGINVKKE